jgi:hypothetical protein
LKYKYLNPCGEIGSPLIRSEDTACGLERFEGDADCHKVKAPLVTIMLRCCHTGIFPDRF